ncbi:hypothetical protein IscW_ISCW008117, partial [Ixodes scapularis]
NVCTFILLNPAFTQSFPIIPKTLHFDPKRISHKIFDVPEAHRDASSSMHRSFCSSQLLRKIGFLLRTTDTAISYFFFSLSRYSYLSAHPSVASSRDIKGNGPHKTDLDRPSNDKNIYKRTP